MEHARVQGVRGKRFRGLGSFHLEFGEVYTMCSGEAARCTNKSRLVTFRRKIHSWGNCGIARWRKRIVTARERPRRSESTGAVNKGIGWERERFSACRLDEARC